MLTHLQRQHFSPGGNLLVNPGNPYLRPELKMIVISPINEGQRNNPKVDQVGLMNPGKALDQLDLDSKVARGQSRVLTRRALAIVVPAHHQARPPGASPSHKIGIQCFINKFTDGRHIAAQGQNLGPGRHDMVRGDIVPDLE